MLVVLSLISCYNEPMIGDLGEEVENPVTYDFVRDGVSTVSFNGQTDRISMATELIHAMTDFSTSEESLLEMYSNQTLSGEDANPFVEAGLNESTKSIKSKIAASYDFFSSNTVESAEIKADLESWIIAQVDEVFPNEFELAAIGQAGQIADGSDVRFVSGKGIEYNQLLNKSLIGALMVDQMLNNYLSPLVLDDGENVENNNNNIVEEGQVYTTMEHKWDEAYGYLFGAAGVNYEDPISSLGADDFLNKYLSRVDEDEDFAGIASEIFEAFKLGRAAIVAKNYRLRDAQANIIKQKISEVVALRAVYYLQQGILSKGNNNIGKAFHDLSEAYGFVYSLRFLRIPNSNNPYFTKTEVNGFINLLTANNGFWDITNETLDNISSKIAERFNFTVAQAAS